MIAHADGSVNRAVLQRRGEHVAMLHGLLPAGRVIHDESGRHVYSGQPGMREATLPLAVVLPANVREVSQVMRYCYEAGIKVTARGGGTSLTGAAGGGEDHVILSLTRMDRVIEIDPANRIIRAEAGIPTDAIVRAAASVGLHYAPDPSSAPAATIGGNIATNAAGARSLSAGPTSNHVLGLKIVLIDGEVVEIGSGELAPAAYDLAGLILGTEGLLGVVVEATLRLVPAPGARHLVVFGFDTIGLAIACATGLIAAGLQPAAIELMDHKVIGVCEDFMPSGLPRDAHALLLVEIDGHADELGQEAAMVVEAAAPFEPAQTLEMAVSTQVDQVWAATGTAFAGLSRLGEPAFIDMSVPPARLGEVLAFVSEIAARHTLDVAHLARAAEGVVRSVLIRNTGDPGSADRADAALGEIAATVREMGGVMVAEHGAGVVKRELVGYQLTTSEMALHARLKSAFDAEWLLNHGKVFPLDAQPNSP